MEFVQFHPPSLYNPTKNIILNYRSLRGADYIKKSQSEDFCLKYDARGVGKRDIVAAHRYRNDYPVKNILLDADI